MLETDVAILGGGVAGLACRAALGTGADTRLLEQASELGGLLRTYEQGRFAFDTCVHVLFFRDPELERWAHQWIPEGVHRFTKQNAIWQYGREIPYPYQYHAYALPSEARDECLQGFAERPRAAGENRSPSFEDWLIAQFGPGFYRHFFRPYNEKVYGLPPAELVAEPMTWMIPGDEHDAVIAGAHGPAALRPVSPSGMASYPRGRRGLASLIDGLGAAPGGSIHTGARVTGVDPEACEVVCESGARYRYRKLVSSLPLPTLLHALGPASRKLLSPEQSRKPWSQLLPATELTMVEVGSTCGGRALDSHWTYFPEADVPFYRLVRLEKISPDLAPPGGVSLLLECQGAPQVDREATLRRLFDLGVLKEPRAEHFRVRRVPCAYVLFTPDARELAKRARAFLEELGIMCVGRYGTWSYSSIEGAIRSGMNAASRLDGVEARA